MWKAVCDFKNSKKKKGFTLIELLIVVAIIAILAAIAIPQFSQYRIRGFNSAANSDIRNLRVQTAAFNTDWQVYASSAAAGAAGDGAMVVGPVSQSTSIVQGGIIAGSPGFPAEAATFNFGVSNGVSAVINTTTATGAQYVAITKHVSGNMGFCADSDKPGINWGAINTAIQLNLGEHNASSTSANDNCDVKYPNPM